MKCGKWGQIRRMNSEAFCRHAERRRKEIKEMLDSLDHTILLPFEVQFVYMSREAFNRFGNIDNDKYRNLVEIYQRHKGKDDDQN